MSKKELPSFVNHKTVDFAIAKIGKWAERKSNLPWATCQDIAAKAVCYALNPCLDGGTWIPDEVADAVFADVDGKIVGRMCWDPVRPCYQLVAEDE